jgi:hypothetical protein
MRSRRHNGWSRDLRDICGHSGPINIEYNTNITSISNVFPSNPCHVDGYNTFAKKRRACRRKNKLSDPKPRLWRFATSLCMLDQDVVSEMNPGELYHESIKGIGYAARGLVSNASDFGHGMCRCVECVAKGVFGVVRAFADACD